jgi:nicotinic acid mononucleotide adenylyltransferase
MARTVIRVPYGYEPEKETIRGSLLVYDAFDEAYSEADLQLMTRWAEEHDLARVVLYPLHEQTLRRMESKSAAPAEPYHLRLERLEEMCEQLAAHNIPVEIDEWERKRKKYTPMETALEFLTDKYKGPHFLGLSGTMANRFATYKSYELWIRKIRLLIRTEEPFQAHPMLVKFENRWETV